MYINGRLSVVMKELPNGDNQIDSFYWPTFLCQLKFSVFFFFSFIRYCLLFSRPIRVSRNALCQFGGHNSIHLFSELIHFLDFFLTLFFSIFLFTIYFLLLKRVSVVIFPETSRLASFDSDGKMFSMF